MNIVQIILPGQTPPHHLVRREARDRQQPGDLRLHPLPAHVRRRRGLLRVDQR